MGLSKARRRWSYTGARKLICGLELKLRPLGWSIGLTGGVLLRGSSTKDLDLIVYPRDTENHKAKSSVRLVLLEAGLRQTLDRHWLRQTWWRLHGTDDDKWVEVYKTEDGRRVDVMFLR